MTWGELVGWAAVAAIAGGVISLGAGALSMSPPDFIVAKVCFTIGALLLVGKLVWSFSRQETLTPQSLLLAAVLFALVGGGWVWSWHWVKGRETPAQIGDDQFFFRDSPLFTESRKRRILADLVEFRQYLKRQKFDLPSQPLPIGIGNRGHNLGPGQVGIGTDRISIYSEWVDDKNEPILAYAHYVVSRLIAGPETFVAYAGTAEFIAREIAADDLSTYFAWSFRGEPKGIATKGWRRAFWAIRERFGPGFADLLLSYTVKSFSQGAAPRMFSSQRVESAPNDFVDYVIYCHLEQAEKVVDNDDAKLPEIQNILEAHKVPIPPNARKPH
jgi:hypothetical protein